MRKTIAPEQSKDSATAELPWIDLDRRASIEVTSEDPAYPVEHALGMGRGAGWRADTAGPQTLRLRFDKPQRVQRIQVRFEESSHERRQEFLLRYSSDGRSYREIVRQQWNFSPSGSTSEAEDYVVSLASVSLLELHIVPDTSGGDARASLAELRIA